MGQIVSLITALILLAAAIVSGQGDIPWWVVLIVVLTFVGWVIITNHHRISSTIKDLIQHRREEKFSKQQWGELRQLAIRLQVTTESGRREIASEIYELAKRAAPDKQNYYNPHSLKDAINVTLGNFIAVMDTQRRNSNSFTASAELLDSLYKLWHNRLVMKQAENLMRDLEMVKYVANQHELQNYNTCKHCQTTLMSDYTQFAKTISSNFRSRVVRLVEFEPIPDLWRG
ncbi:hypothetical protein ACFLV4_05840 [Chloroflexota bacterium]